MSFHSYVRANFRDFQKHRRIGQIRRVLDTCSSPGAEFVLCEFPEFNIEFLKINEHLIKFNVGVSCIF